MNPSIPVNERIGRRRALATLGAAGAGVVLTACGGNNGSDRAFPTATTSTTLAGGDDGSTLTTGATTSATSAAPASGASSLAGRFDDAASCSLTTELTEGPYYIDVDSIRRDIREDREGTRLRVGIRVFDETCQPIPDAIVEIWHCDALGIYSGFESASTGGGGGSSGIDDTRYLRGGQITDAEGIAEFTTVYPGWYRGRTVHIHTKVHVSNRDVLTTQLFFDEAVTETVYQQEPYVSDPGRDSFNATDGIFDERLILTLSEEGGGYLGLITYVVSTA